MIKVDASIHSKDVLIFKYFLDRMTRPADDTSTKSVHSIHSEIGNSLHLRGHFMNVFSIYIVQ